MITLAIETSTNRGSIALLRDGECVLARAFASERSHNSQIFAPLGEALELANPELIVVGTGPGSYTGARIGIAAGIGISLSHGATLIGLPSVIAAEVPDPEMTYHIVGGARRGSVFYAEVARRQLAGEPELLEAGDLGRRLSRRNGVGRDNVFSFDRHPPGPDTVRVTQPSAQILAEIAAGLDPAEIAALAAAPVVPHYMGAPFVTTPKKRPRSG